MTASCLNRQRRRPRPRPALRMARAFRARCRLPCVARKARISDERFRPLRLLEGHYWIGDEPAPLVCRDRRDRSRSLLVRRQPTRAPREMRAIGEMRDGRRLRWRDLHSCRRVYAEPAGVAVTPSVREGPRSRAVRRRHRGCFAPEPPARVCKRSWLLDGNVRRRPRNAVGVVEDDRRDRPTPVGMRVAPPAWSGSC